MGTTHFIQVYKVGRILGQSHEPFDIGLLDRILNNTPTIETVAVWRIKQTDVPIEQRLSERLGVNGLCHKDFFESIHKI